MEETLTLEELYLLIDSIYRTEQRHNKFYAAMNGVDLEEGEKNADFERIKQRAAADLAGKSEEEYVFDMIGIEVDNDDE
jgi:hypothetical protein